MGKRKVLSVIIIIFVVFSVVSFLFVGVNFYFVFRRFEKPTYSRFLEYDDVKDRYPREEISFTSGKNKLQGYLYGKDNNKGLIVICHGVFSGARGYLGEALYFAEQGYQVFSFDYTGYCQSEGKSSVGLRQAVHDLDAALTFVEQDKRFCEGPLFLYGHSWGGYAVTSILAYDHPVQGVVSLSGFNKPEEIIIEWAKKEIGPIAVVEYPYVDVVQRILFGKEGNASAVDAINSCDTPVMIVFGSKDDVVSFDKAGIIAYRDEITNPNVIYVIRDQDKINNHTNLYRSPEAAAYLEELDEQYDALKKQFGRKLNDDIERQFYDSIDKNATSALDEEFLQSVVVFYEQCEKR